MDIKQVGINIYRQLFNKNTIENQSKTFLKRFKRNAFIEGECVEYGQFEASITKLYHSVEKGLTYDTYKAGFGRNNIDKLIKSMSQFSKKYDVDAFFYETALSVLEKYIEKNKEYGLVDEELENIIRNLPGENNGKGGTIEFQRPDASVRSMGFKEFVEDRHSIRHFSKEPVSLELLKSAIELAQFTPSACNRQGWRCKIISNRQILQELLANQNGNRGFGEEIDKLLVVVSDLHYFSRGRELFQAFIDGGMYSMNLIHALHYFGIGSIPLSASLNYNQEIRVREILHMSESEVLIMFIGVGNYPEGTIKTTRSDRRKPTFEIID